MSDYIIYHNPNCSKSRQTLEILKGKNVKLEVREYLKSGLSLEELSFILNSLIEEIDTVVRVKESQYQDNPFDVKSREEVCKNLIIHPILLERPIVIKDNVAIICRPVEKLQRLL